MKQGEVTVLKDPCTLLNRSWGTGREGEKKREMGVCRQVSAVEGHWRNVELIGMVTVNIPHSVQL